MKELLQQLQQRDLDRLDGKSHEIKEIYRSLPSRIESASKLTGITPDELIDTCVIVSMRYAFEWYDLLSFVQSFHATYNRLHASQSEGK